MVWRGKRTLQEDQHVQFEQLKLVQSNRDLGQSSMSPGDGMMELRDGAGNVIGGMGDLPDGTFGVGIFRNGVMKNVNAFFYDTGQIDSAFTQRDTRLDGHDQRLAQKDANDASHQAQLTTLRGDVTRLDAVDASIASQLGDRPTYSVFNGAVSSLSGRVNNAQSAADSAQGAANNAQGTANSAAGAASNAQNTANAGVQQGVMNTSQIVYLTAKVKNLQDQIDKMKGLPGGG